jgi:hypothetical protein
MAFMQNWITSARSQSDNGVYNIAGAGAPTSGTSGTAVGVCGPGSTYTDATNAIIYLNTGTLASPTWTAIGNGPGEVKPSNLGLLVINKTGSDIVTDKVVAVTTVDATSGNPKIVLADADVAAHDNLWITTATIANNASGVVYKGATSAATLNTNSFTSAGDAVYLSTTAGGFTQTAPTTAISRVHVVGYVLVKSATVGQILWQITTGPRLIGTNEIQALSITNALAAGMTRGTVKVGNSTGAASDLVASVSGQILLGDGTDINSTAVTGDVTISGAGVTAIGANKVLSTMIATNTLQRASGQITSANITGTSAGQLGHANGVVLVATPGANVALQIEAFSAYYAFATAAYTGGGDDVSVRWGAGGAAITGVTTKANLLGASGNKAVYFSPLSAAATPIVSNASINLVATTAYTQPGTAAGVLNWEIWYRTMAVGF